MCLYIVFSLFVYGNKIKRRLYFYKQNQLNNYDVTKKYNQ
jgi:hypothetical protein